jgi:RNA polymerase sigma factor (TIGR02999 family)
MSDVTMILQRLESGEAKAADELLPLVYEELRRLAGNRLAREKPGQTLQPTALVHEAWIRLAGSGQQWNGRGHFFGAAAEAMRRILIEQARRKSAQKRGSGVVLEQLEESRVELKVPADEFLAVHEAIDGLQEEDTLAAEVVKLRYFIGMRNGEIAEALGISPSTVDRHWAFARAWLKGVIKK